MTNIAISALYSTKYRIQFIMGNNLHIAIYSLYFSSWLQ